jgi:hypothetical protein
MSFDHYQLHESCRDLLREMGKRNIEDWRSHYGHLQLEGDAHLVLMTGAIFESISPPSTTLVGRRGNKMESLVTDRLIVAVAKVFQEILAAGKGDSEAKRLKERHGIDFLVNEGARSGS